MKTTGLRVPPQTHRVVQLARATSSSWVVATSQRVTGSSPSQAGAQEETKVAIAH